MSFYLKWLCGIKKRRRLKYIYRLEVPCTLLLPSGGAESYSQSRIRLAPSHRTPRRRSCCLSRARRYTHALAHYVNSCCIRIKTTDRERELKPQTKCASVGVQQQSSNGKPTSTLFTLRYGKISAFFIELLIFFVWNYIK